MEAQFPPLCQREKKKRKLPTSPSPSKNSAHKKEHKKLNFNPPTPEAQIQNIRNVINSVTSPSPTKTPAPSKEQNKSDTNPTTPDAIFKNIKNIMTTPHKMPENEWKTDGPRPKPKRTNHKELNLVQCSVMAATESELNRVDEQNRRVVPVNIPTLNSTIKSIANLLNAKPAKLFIMLNGAFRDFAFTICKRSKSATDITEALEGIGLAAFTDKARDATLKHTITLRGTIATSSEENNFFDAASEKISCQVAEAATTALKDPTSKENIIALLSTAINQPSSLTSNIAHAITGKEASYELAIRTANLSDVWALAMETLPSGSPTKSLQTLSEELHDLEIKNKSTEDSAFRSTERIKNITSKVSQLTVAEVISRHQGVEAMLRLHSLNNIKGFRVADRSKKEELVRSLTQQIAPRCNYELELIYPQEKATKQFEPLAILTFSNPQQKYTFEKLFSVYRRGNPEFKISSSRAKPDSSIHDAHLQTDDEVRRQIGKYYNKAIEECKDPLKAFSPLTDNEVQAMQLNQKTLKNPPRVYYEFLDPSNGTFFSTFSPNFCPFKEHDFRQPIPNPHLRKIADHDAQYKQKFKPRPFQKQK